MRCFCLRTLQLFCFLILIMGICMVFLPHLISTDWGRKKVIKGINYFIPGQIDIEALQLQWTKKQMVRGLILKDPKGEVILKVERILIEAPFWKLLTQSIHLGLIQIKELNATLAIDEKGQNNFQYALGIIPDITPVSHLSFLHVNTHLHLLANYHSFVFWAKGMIQQQNHEGVFEMDFALNGLRLSKWKNFMHDIQQYFLEEGSRRAAIQLKIINFPTHVIDRLLSFKSHSKQFFHFLLGSYVNVFLNKEIDDEGRLTAKIQTPFVEGEMRGQLANGIFTLQKSAHLHLDITLEFLQNITHPHTQLYQLAQMNITVPYLFIPLAKLNSQDFCECGFKFEAVIGKTEMNFHPIGLLNIDHIKFQLNSKRGDSGLHFTSIGFVENDKKSIRINFDRWFMSPSHFSIFIQNVESENFIAEF